MIISRSFILRMTNVSDESRRENQNIHFLHNNVTINNGTIPRDWKKAIIAPIHKGGDRSVVKNHRPVSLTSVVCKQMNAS